MKPSNSFAIQFGRPAARNSRAIGYPWDQMAPGTYFEVICLPELRPRTAKNLSAAAYARRQKHRSEVYAIRQFAEVDKCGVRVYRTQ